MSNKEEVRYVKLRKYDRKAGHLTRRYSHKCPNGQYISFDTPGVWYKVPIWVAEKLEEVRQIPSRENSALVFDICTEAEARKKDLKERIEREKKRAIVEPSVDTALVLDVDEGSPGRGDISLDDIVGSRSKALEKSMEKFNSLLDPEEAPKKNKKRGRPKKKVANSGK